MFDAGRGLGKLAARAARRAGLARAIGRAAVAGSGRLG